MNVYKKKEFSLVEWVLTIIGTWYWLFIVWILSDNLLSGSLSHNPLVRMLFVGLQVACFFLPMGLDYLFNTRFKGKKLNKRLFLYSYWLASFIVYIILSNIYQTSIFKVWGIG